MPSQPIAPQVLAQVQAGESVVMVDPLLVCDFCANFGSGPTPAAYMSRNKIDLSAVVGLADKRRLYVCECCHEALIVGSTPGPNVVTTAELVKI